MIKYKILALVMKISILVIAIETFGNEIQIWQPSEQ